MCIHICIDVCCSVLQCVAVCCVLQCVAVRGSVLQYIYIPHIHVIQRFDLNLQKTVLAPYRIGAQNFKTRKRPFERELIRLGQQG